MKKLPEQKYLKECFDYIPENGHLIWKTRPAEHFKNIYGSKPWNKKYPGKRAGAVNLNGYRQVIISGNHYFEHRLIWKLLTGKDSILCIDHIDGNKQNNKIENLREATKSQNMLNRGIQKNNKSGFKCVFADKRSGKYMAYINLGLFETPEDAYKAYCDASKHLHGEFSNVG